MGAPYTTRQNDINSDQKQFKNKGLAKVLVVTTCACVLSFSYGMFAATYKVFPFEEIKQVKRMFVEERSGKAKQPSRAERERQARKAMFEQAQTHADIVFVGDSITQAGEWAEFFPDLRVLNRGLNGDETADVLARIDDVIATNPHHAFISLGLNDMLRAKPMDQAITA